MVGNKGTLTPFVCASASVRLNFSRITSDVQTLAVLIELLRGDFELSSSATDVTGALPTFAGERKGGD